MKKKKNDTANYSILLKNSVVCCSTPHRIPPPAGAKSRGGILVKAYIRKLLAVKICS